METDPVGHQIADLDALGIVELRAKWVELFGGRPPAIQSTDVLKRLLAWKLQVKALGGIDPETTSRLGRLKSALVKGKPVALSPSLGLSVGTILTREWRGIEHRVLVLDQGFEHQGNRYGSLSKVARVITGSQWSGPRFFGLEEGQELARDLADGAAQ